MKSPWLLVFLLGLLSCSHCVPQIDEAMLYNSNFAPQLLGGQNACGLAARAPEMGNPFSISEARVVGLLPMAANVTSDLSNVSLLWSWSASYPASASFVQASSIGCPDGQYILHSPSSARFVGGKLAYSYGNNSYAVELFSDGPNPVSLQLEKNGDGQRGFEGLYANLSARISGRISVAYQFRSVSYRQRCQAADDGGGQYCFCEQKTEAGTRTYEEEVGEARDFGVETGPDAFVWLNPPLQARLEGNESVKLLLFARRMPARISVYADGLLLGQASPYSFFVHAGSCGEKVVEAQFMPEGHGMGVSMGNGTVFPYQLVEKNASYLPFFLQFGWAQKRGEASSEILVEDWFSHQESFGRNFSVRMPESFSSNQTSAAVAIRGADASTSPAIYPARNAPASAYPDLSALAPLLAVGLCLGAYGLLGLAGGWRGK